MVLATACVVILAAPHYFWRRWKRQASIAYCWMVLVWISLLPGAQSIVVPAEGVIAVLICMHWVFRRGMASRSWSCNVPRGYCPKVTRTLMGVHCALTGILGGSLAVECLWTGSIGGSIGVLHAIGYSVALVTAVVTVYLVCSLVGVGMAWGGPRPGRAPVGARGAFVRLETKLGQMSSLWTGLTLRAWIKVVARAARLDRRVVMRPAFVVKFALIACIALLNTVLAASQRIGVALILKSRSGGLLKRSNLQRRPVFIVGHWRSGTSYLHEVMARHPGLSAPTTLNVSCRTYVWG